MSRFLPAPVLGVIMSSFFVLNLVFWAIPVYAAIFLKALSPPGALRDRVSRLTAWLAQHWAGVNTLFGDFLLGTEWDIRGAEHLNPRGQYLVTCNHQSWNDIYVLMKTFGRKAPFFKFFIKQELIWVPILGIAWWGLDFPFMKRYSAQKLVKHPELRGKDLETTRRACEKYRNQPVLLLNFLEGTRFTQAKHDKQASPYRHLLKPKAGGFAFALAAMGEKLNDLLDVTIVYPDGAVGFGDFMQGRMRRVIVEVRKLTVPAELFRGRYDDPQAKKHVQDFVLQLWAEKDRRIGEIKAGLAAG